MSGLHGPDHFCPKILTIGTCQFRVGSFQGSAAHARSQHITWFLLVYGMDAAAEINSVQNMKLCSVQPVDVPVTVNVIRHLNSGTCWLCVEFSQAFAAYARSPPTYHLAFLSPCPGAGAHMDGCSS